MDVREKLVELIGSTEYGNGSLVGNNFQKGFIEKIATHLVANGVTVQEWISLSEQKPNRDDLVIVFFDGMRDTPAAIQIMRGWCIGGSASHWMPIPQPPKGE